MKKTAILLLNVLIFISTAWAESPHEIGGFVLGQEISAFKNQLKMESVMPIRHIECLKELEIKSIEGFKSGLIYYTTCAAQERIVRIKLKYSDSSAQFYEALLKRFKKRFGEPDEWRGDPFHVVVAWKWYFTDKDKNKISLLLQHNTRDTEQKIGNSIKLTLSTLMEAERNCFKKHKKYKNTKIHSTKWKDVKWEKMIPR